VCWAEAPVEAVAEVAPAERHDVVYVCNCGGSCTCNYVSDRPDTCTCGMELKQSV
jgi:hypothetical protein